MKRIYSTALCFSFLACTAADSANDGNTVECGNGTTLVNGRCLADAVCAEGTELVDGECVVDASNCPEGSTADDGVCVADAPCAAGTEEVDGECVPTVECGPDTEVDNGQCVPSEELECSDGTIKQGDECVDESYGVSSIEHFTTQLSRTICEGIFECCDPDSLSSYDLLGAFNSPENCEFVTSLYLRDLADETQESQLTIVQEVMTAGANPPLDTNVDAMNALIDGSIPDANCDVSSAAIDLLELSLQSAQEFTNNFVLPGFVEGDSCADSYIELLFPLSIAPGFELCEATTYCGQTDSLCVDGGINDLCPRECLIKKAEGEACSDDKECEAGTRCSDSSDTCSVVFDIPILCGLTDITCDSATEWCDGASCEDYTELTEECDVDAECPPHAVCADPNLNDVDTQTICIIESEIIINICDAVQGLSAG